MTLVSEIDQKVTLEAPAAIDNVSSPGGTVEMVQADRDDSVVVTLEVGKVVTLQITLR